jgi:hypothetical protein
MSGARSRFRAVIASSNRPAAFSRGASTKPIVFVVTFPGAIPATPRSALSPGRLAALILRRPNETNVWFSPTKATISATVPNATRSSRSSAAISRCVVSKGALKFAIQLKGDADSC